MPLFAVLFVCEGNQCRSPAAEHVFRRARAARTQRLDPGLTIETMSAGTRAAEGHPIHPLTAAALVRAGFTVPPHASTRVSAEAVGVADLVLTADRQQRTIVAALAGGAAGRTFTLLEFASLGAAVRARAEPAGPTELVTAAARSRGPAWNDPRHDLPDPISGDAATHAAVLDQVIRATRAVAQLLNPPGSSDASPIS